MHIAFGCMLSSDWHAARSFDFMLANPLYGKSWKFDAECIASSKKMEILDARFNAATADGELLTMQDFPEQRVWLLEGIGVAAAAG